MPSLTHSIQIEADLDWTFEQCRNVARWHLYMPAVRHAKFIEKFDDHDVVEVTAEAGSEIWTWRSARRLDRSNWRISFERIAPAPPIASLRGSWQFTRHNESEVTILLSHEFSTTTSNLDYENFLQASIRKNVIRDLSALASLAKTQSFSKT